ncbi:MAG: hypothetical protein JO165_03325 [Candidatus Eremiobacteraeota bacterium]|nr:hypothetical protein [Candidatus Eremiobacteraeota bacterium]
MSQRNQTLLARAFFASLVVHAVVALLIPAWTRSQSGGTQSVETISFARIARVRIERLHTPQPVPQVTAPHTPHRDPHIRFARVRTELTKNQRSKIPRTPPPQRGPRGEIATAPDAEKEQTQVPIVAQAAIHTPSPVTTPPDPDATPHPQSSADRDVNGSGEHETGGVLPFGASMAEPVLDPKVHDELLRRFKIHVTLRVVVGDNGKTKSVVFSPPLDTGTEHAIEALLADANWDAAVCGGGIACEGTAVITL